MGLNEQTTGSIYGSQIIGQCYGTSTGDVQYKTADGRVWSELRNGVPASLPTGTIVSSIKR